MSFQPLHMKNMPVLCWFFVGIVALGGIAKGAEQNPPGDIPDDQVFITYSSPSGAYSLKVPEGWQRTEKGSSVDFLSKYDGISVTLASAPAAPTIAGVTSTLQKGDSSLKINSAKEVRLPAGPALHVKYESDSKVNAVTGKSIPLENEAFVLYRAGKTATLTLWAPKGADNADQWKLISESFRW
jgi:hypothetical protein